MNDLGVPVAEPPTDGISALRFASNSNLLLASSWDGNVHLYDGLSGARQAVLAHGAPVLDATFDTDASTIYSGGLDNLIKRTDISTSQQTSSVIGSHDAAVKCVEWLPSRGLLASAGWDSALKLWDPRLNSQSGPVSILTLPGKAFSMSTNDTATGNTDARLVVATSGRHIEICDIRSLGTTTSTTIPNTNTAVPGHTSRESSLKFQTRCVRCFPTGDGYAISSVEGRVGIDYFDPSENIQAKKYAFKCHRKAEMGKDVVYPVNSIAYNNVYGTFVTGGCDGVVNFWDGSNKKRLHQVHGYPTSIAATAFNNDAKILAIAASYTYERGDAEHPPDAIYLRKVATAEILPRQKTTAV